MFSVYDGHGGAAASEFCMRQLHTFVLKDPNFATDKKSALINGFIETDKFFRSVVYFF